VCCCCLALRDHIFKASKFSDALDVAPEVPEQKWHHPESGSYPLDAVEKSCTWHGFFSVLPLVFHPDPHHHCWSWWSRLSSHRWSPFHHALWSFGNAKIWTTWSNKSKAPRMIWWACSFFNAFQTKRRMKTRVYQRGLSSIFTPWNELKGDECWRRKIKYGQQNNRWPQAADNTVWRRHDAEAKLPNLFRKPRKSASAVVHGEPWTGHQQVL
jgi:hypothetical protein